MTEREFYTKGLEIYKNIKFSRSVATNQGNLFGSGSVKYQCTIEYDGVRKSFVFQLNPNYHPKEVGYMKLSALSALFRDASAYRDARDFKDFCLNFGYTWNRWEDEDGYKEAARAWNGCKRNNEKVYDLFDEEIAEFMTMWFLFRDNACVEWDKLEEYIEEISDEKETDYWVCN